MSDEATFKKELNTALQKHIDNTIYWNKIPEHYDMGWVSKSVWHIEDHVNHFLTSVNHGLTILISRLEYNNRKWLPDIYVEFQKDKNSSISVENCEKKQTYIEDCLYKMIVTEFQNHLEKKWGLRTDDN